jgi:hypothetical protein
MMNRLVEQTDSRHPLVVRAAKLLESAQPLAPSDAMRRRVLASVVRDHFAAHHRWLARPAALVAVLLATTAAAAAFHESWFLEVVRLTVERVAPRSWQTARRAPGDRAKSAGRALATDDTVLASRERALTPSEAVLESGVEASLLAEGVVAAESGRAAIAEADVALDPSPSDARSRSSRRARRAKAIAPQHTWDDGASLVLSAIEVLRRQHDAARASRMLEAYLGSYPRGSLREEAMALAVEAASVRGDGGESRRLAARYEHAFPAGRFRTALRASASQGSL